MKRIKTILKETAKVRNMVSSKGNVIPNQFIINTKTAIIFQSYNSIIVIKTGGQTILDEHYWNYSVTTSKYRNEFLGEGIEVTRDKINSGIYKLAKLN